MAEVQRVQISCSSCGKFTHHLELAVDRTGTLILIAVCPDCGLRFHIVVEPEDLRRRLWEPGPAQDEPDADGVPLRVH